MICDLLCSPKSYIKDIQWNWFLNKFIVHDIFKYNYNFSKYSQLQVYNVLTSFRPQLIISRNNKTTEVKHFITNLIEDNSCLCFVCNQFKKYKNIKYFVIIFDVLIVTCFIVSCCNVSSLLLNIYKLEANKL